MSNIYTGVGEYRRCNICRYIRVPHPNLEEKVLTRKLLEDTRIFFRTPDSIGLLGLHCPLLSILLFECIQ